MELVAPVSAVPVRLTNPVERMRRAHAEMTAASADFLEAIWDCDDQRLWRRDGATSLTSWLAARFDATKATAAEWALVARTARQLPLLFQAYRSRRLSWDKLRPLVRFVTPATEALWAHRAPRLRPSTLWREVERHRRVRARDEAEARRRRSLSTWWDEDRMLCLSGALPPEEGAAVEAALSRRAEDVVLADEPDSPGEARMADALVELVTAGGDGQPAPATLVVHAEVEVVARP